MKLTNKAIEYKTSIVVLTVILSVAGLFSYATISKESFPSIEFPNIIVTTVYAGASPDDIESLITQQIEQEIQGVSGIKEIRSTSTEGVSSIVIEFNPEVPIDDALQKVRDKVDLAKPDLPTDAEDPIITEIDLTEIPVMTINLAADYPLTRLKEVADNLADELETIPSVLEVTVTGDLEREVQINVDLNKLQGYNLSFGDIADAIRSENTNIPGGSVDVDRLNYLVRVDGEFRSPDEIEAIVIDTPNGKPVYIRDVATVDFGFKDRASFARLQVLQHEDEHGDLHHVNNPDQGVLPVISLGVKKRSGDNILDTAEAVKSTVDAYPLPSGTRIAITGDQSEGVLTMVKDLENNIISGLLFVVAVLLFFLGVRNSFLVGIAIPLSMFITFLYFQTMGYTLNFVILFSLIIALGMLVDNAIVIVENIYRFRENGLDKFEAARQGTAEVGMPVVASTATTVAAFAPMLFWPGITGKFMSYMPLTLIVTLTCSLFVALVINPVITGIFIRLENEEKRERATKLVRYLSVALIIMFAVIIGIANWISLIVLGLAGAFFYYSHKYMLKPLGQRFSEQLLPAFIDRYRIFLGWMLQRDYSVKHALLRNAFALGSFTVGFMFMIVYLIINAMFGAPASYIPLAIGGVLTLVGLLAIIFHALEGIFVGRGKSVRAGLILAVIIGAILFIMNLTPKEVDMKTVLDLMLLPGLIIFFGLLGVLFARRPYYVLTDNRSKLLNGVVGALFGIIAMFVIANPGTEFFPDTDPNQIQVTLTGQLGTNIDESNRIAKVAQDRLSNLLSSDEVSASSLKNIQTGVGVGGDFDFGGGGASPEVSRITMNLVDYADRAESSKITMQRLRDELAGIPGVEIEFTKDQAGPPTGPPVNIEITGENFDTIVKITKDVKQILTEAAASGKIPGLVDIVDNLNTGRPELRVHIDRERAARAGLNTATVATAIRSAINGIEVGKYRENEDEYDIVARLDKIDRSDLESLSKLTVLYEGTQIPVVSVADFEVTGGLGSITRLDLQRVAIVNGDVTAGTNTQQTLALVQAELADYEANMPTGYKLSYTGESEDQAEAFGFLGRALLIGVALIFMIMVAQFNRVSFPFIIMVAVGLSLVGVLLGLILTRTAFGLMTFIGVISLAGIVVNNNIVLIDYIMQLRDRGMEKTLAIIEGGATRLRPVLLTAITTVIGLIPLTLGIGIDFVGLVTEFRPGFQFGSENTQFWGPMGTAIITGLTFATFLTLIIVPVMYSVFDSLSLRLSKATREPIPVKHAGDGYASGGNGHGSALPPTEPVRRDVPTDVK